MGSDRSAANTDWVATKVENESTRVLRSTRRVWVGYRSMDLNNVNVPATIAGGDKSFEPEKK